MIGTFRGACVHVLVWGFLFLGPIYAVAGEARIALGDQHTCVVTDLGTVACWGANGHGQLGTGVIGGEQPTPQPVVNLSDVVAVSAGKRHACALKTSGKVLCWGSNEQGQLGLGMNGADQPTPQPIPDLDQVIAISAGGFFTCALQATGQVRCWGYNLFGELGLGDQVGGYQPTPQPVSLLSNVVSLDAGLRHACALQADGQVLCWGDNSSGQLGTGVAGGQQPMPQSISGLNNVVALSAGSQHTCALQGSGEVACWGANGYGELGLGMNGADEPAPQLITDLSDVMAISAGNSFTCRCTQAAKFSAGATTRSASWGWARSIPNRNHN